MRSRFFSILAGAVLASGAAVSSACGQDTASTPQGVRIGLTYGRGTTPRVVVLPVDTTAGDSIRTMIQRDLDYSDRVSPLIVDDATLQTLQPTNGEGSFNYPLFAQLGAAAIVQARRTPAGLRVALYDVAAKRRVNSAELPITGIPPVRDRSVLDSVAAATDARERTLRDSVNRVLRARAALMRRPPLKKDERPRRFIVRDSLRRDSAATAYVRRNLTRWENERRDSVEQYVRSTVGRLAREDSVARLTAAEEERMSIHRVSDEIERWITGRRGIAATRITYSHRGLIRVVDSDGANDKALTRSGTALSPAWHPNGRRIVYSTISEGGSRIVEVDVVTGRTRTITDAGLNLTPIYSNDGRYIVYANGIEGGTDLMMVPADSASAPQRLTFGGGSDNTSPTFSPDGRRIAFISARSRFPQVYTMDADGSNLELLTPFTPGRRSYRTAPDWSPDGRAVAYEQQNGDFQVWMIDLRDREPRRLTSEGENEGPSWAPDGRHLAISSTRGGSKQIWILDTESGRFRQLTHQAGARLPDWSGMMNPVR